MNATPKNQLPHLLALLVLTIWPSAHAASFDCSKAASSVEKMICASADLSSLDRKLADDYRSARTFQISDQARAELLQSQRKWLGERNRCGDEKCLERLYQGRIAELSGKPAAAGPTAAPATAPSPPAQAPETIPASSLYATGGYWVTPGPQIPTQTNRSCSSIANGSNLSMFFRFSPGSRHFISKMQGTADSRFSKPVKIEVFGNQGALFVGIVEPIDKGTTISTYQLNPSENILYRIKEECIQCSPLLPARDDKKVAYVWCTGEP